MLHLIMREIRDHLIYVLACCFLSLFTIGIMICGYVWHITQVVYLFPVLLTPVLFLGLAALGTAQMYTDRANRVSALLSTLAVTRSRILAARVIVGALALLVVLAPALLAALVLLNLAAVPAPLYSRMIWEIPATVALAGFACYCVGLEVGWTTSKIWPAVGNVLLVSLVTSLVFSKGFGLDAMLLLLLFVAAMLVHTWYRFTSASL
jgi:hypothetical protein